MRGVFALALLMGIFGLITSVTVKAAAKADAAYQALYAADCIVTLHDSEHVNPGDTRAASIPCAVSLFAHFNFRTNGQLVYDKLSTLCTESVPDEHALPAAVLISNNGNADIVLAVDRGACSFDEKAANAEKLGYRALLIVDQTRSAPTAVAASEGGGAAAGPSSASSSPSSAEISASAAVPSMTVPFPMGAADSSYKSSIPVLMVRAGDMERFLLRNRACSSDIAAAGTEGCPAAQSHISLQYNKAPVEGTGHGSVVAAWRATMNKAPLLLGRAGLTLLCLFLVLATWSSSTILGSSDDVASGSPLVSPQTSGKRPAHADTTADVSALAVGKAGSLGADKLLTKDTDTDKEKDRDNSRLLQITSIFFFVVPYSIVLCFAAACRLGTFRVLVADGFAEYHHNETDEKVFETLTRAVEVDWRHYYLTRDDISRLRLSPENYGDNLFIHPPFFVYVSMLMVRYCGVSTATVSLLFHLGVMLLLPVMVHYCGFDVRDKWKQHRADPLKGKGHDGHNEIDELLTAPPITSVSAYYSEGAVTLWALVIYTLDPLAFFCSQKYWIDNALLFSVTAVATIHLITWRRFAARRIRSKTALATRSLISGAIYGLLVLNCKITGLAQLPFLLSWIFVSMIEVVGVGTIITCCFVPYITGAAAAYMPWLCVYHSHTGRWLPNAWPSASMLKGSEFLRVALSKPITFYLEMLLEFSPMQVLGISFGLVVSSKYIGKHMWQFLHCNSRRARINGDNFVAYGGSGHVTALISWPVSFIAGLTLVGVLGGGFQARFMLPILPATSVLAARCVHRASSIRHGNSTSLAGVQVLTAVALAYSSMHCLYYGMLFTNLYADLDVSMFSVLSEILSRPYSPVSSPQVMQELLKFMAHFGLHLKSK